MKSSSGQARNRICNSILRLEQYILAEEYNGYDPYDALLSPLFRLPILSSSRVLRFGGQQLFKRLQWNVRPALGIPKRQNPVTFGLCLQAFTYLQFVFPDRKRLYESQAAKCLVKLTEHQSKGYSGACWGYDFDWESRYSTFPAYTPTIVVTGINTNALFIHHELTGSEESLALCTSAADFVVKDLHRMYEDNMLCFSYSPQDTQRVLNASMKAARLMTQVQTKTHDEVLKGLAHATVQYVLKHQRNDGAWPYAIGDDRQWVDNFHTGYVLDCLDEYVRMTEDPEAKGALVKGVEYYHNHFLAEGGRPKYYDNAIFPIDSTAAAQTILTLTRFGFMTEAEAVALWMIDNMQDGRGYFYYRAFGNRVVRISFMRWSNAWMLLALAYFLYRQHALV